MAVQQRKQQQRQAARKGAAGDAAAGAPAADAPPSALAIARFAALQHCGLVLCALGIILLALGYDRGWMHNTQLSMVALAFCLLGLFFHETRPYKVGAPRACALVARLFSGACLRRPRARALACGAAGCRAARADASPHPAPTPCRTPQRDEEFAKRAQDAAAEGKDA
jgi:hypothetical protein